MATRFGSRHGSHEEDAMPAYPLQISRLLRVARRNHRALVTDLIIYATVLIALGAALAALV
jgi:hypothetical protein